MMCLYYVLHLKFLPHKLSYHTENSALVLYAYCEGKFEDPVKGQRVVLREMRRTVGKRSWWTSQSRDMGGPQMIPTELFLNISPKSVFCFLPSMESTHARFGISSNFPSTYPWHSQQKWFLFYFSFPQAKGILSHLWNIVEYVDLREMCFSF